jgi:PAS domain S-box-containing protein
MNAFLQENLDLAVWVATLFCAFLAMLAILVRTRRADPAVLRVATLGVIAIAIAAFINDQASSERELSRIATLLLPSAPAYAQLMEKMGHENITSDTSPSDPRYLAIVDESLEWLRLNPNAKGIYTCRRTPDGKLILIIDPEADLNGDGKIAGIEERTAIGKEWNAAVPDLDEAFQGKAVMTSKPYKDEWGEWLTAFSPLHDAQGRVEAVLGVDYPAAEWMAFVQKAGWMNLLRWSFIASLFLGACGMTSAMRSDLQQRRRIETELRETDQRYRHLAEQSRNLVLELDVPARRIRYASPNHADVLGYTPSDLVGRDALTMVHPEDQQLLAQSLAKQKITASVRCRHRRGHWLCMEMAGTRFEPTSGESRVQVVCRDTTEQREREEKFQQVEKMHSMGHLASGLAHDFNNLLTIVQGYTDLMLENGNLPDEQRSMLRLVDEAAVRAANLTRQLLSFGKMQRLQRTNLNLNKVLGDIKDMLQSLLGEQITLHTNFDAGLPEIAADLGLVEQVLVNLALNARDSMPNGGHLSIRTSCAELDAKQADRHPQARAGRFVTVSFTDTGEGMDEEMLKHLFEPFYPAKETGQGTGLGLASAYGIVNQHGGWIEVTSHVGAGSKIDVLLPVTTVLLSAEGPAPAAPPSNGKGSESILVVEDEPVLLQLAEEILTRQGYKVRTARSGREAVASIGSGDQDYDLLLTDVVMPGGLSGGQLAQILKHRKPHLRVLYTTGYSPDNIGIGLALHEGINYLPKPYNGHRLTSAVRACLDCVNPVI